MKTSVAGCLRNKLQQFLQTSEMLYLLEVSLCCILPCELSVTPSLWLQVLLVECLLTRL